MRGATTSRVHRPSASVAVTTRGSRGANAPSAARELAERADELDARGQRVARDLVVQPRRRADRARASCRAPRRAAVPRPAWLKQLERGARRTRVGVVGVVDQRRRAVPLPVRRASAARASPRCRAPRRRRRRRRSRATARASIAFRRLCDAAQRDDDLHAVHRQRARARRRRPPRVGPGDVAGVEPRRRHVARARARGVDDFSAATPERSRPARRRSRPSPRAARHADRPVPRDAPRRSTSPPSCSARRSRAAAAPRRAGSSPSRRRRRRRRRESRAA